MRIDGLTGSSGVAVPPASPGAGRSTAFEELLRASLRETNQLQLQAETLMESLAAGQPIDPEVVALAVNKADLAFRLVVQIRNKLVQAFQELRQMQV